MSTVFTPTPSISSVGRLPFALFQLIYGSFNGDLQRLKRFVCRLDSPQRPTVYFIGHLEYLQYLNLDRTQKQEVLEMIVILYFAFHFFFPFHLKFKFRMKKRKFNMNTIVINKRKETMDLTH